MMNREKTFYSLRDIDDLNHIRQVADSTEPNMFYDMGWLEKWGSDLLTYKNNIAFLDRIRDLQSLDKLFSELKTQFQLYDNKIEWIKHTIFICKNEFHKTKGEIFSEAIKWCEEKLEIHQKPEVALSIDKILEDPDVEENDFIFSTIEDWLAPFKDKKILIDENYDNLVHDLQYYFNNKEFKKELTAISVGKVNKKRFGWALNNIFRSLNDNNEKLPIEYLRYFKANISVFKETSFDEKKYLKSNLYKYFTTKTN